MSEDRGQTPGETIAYENAALKGAVIALTKEVAAISPGAQSRVVAQLRNGADRVDTVNAQTAPGLSSALKALAKLIEDA